MSTATSRWRITFADNTIGEPEIDAVAGVLRSRWLSAGALTRRFELEFAAEHGVPDAVAVSSGTAALHLAAMALRLGAGDEVILPSLTFVASAAVVTLQGATPVFADIRSARDLTIDPGDVERLTTARTKAIVAMHYGGHPADLTALRAIAAECGAALVEDAAHAPMVEAPGGKLGTHGDLGCFSFHATKNATTGEGGMVVARDPGTLRRIRLMRSHHLTTSTEERARSGDVGYDVPGLGLNYRPTEISAALGRVQLDRLAADRVHRRELVALYRTLLGGIPGIEIPFAGREGDSAFHLMAILLPAGLDRAAVRAELTAAGIQTSMHYPPTHRFSFYRRLGPRAGRALPVTEDVASRLLSLPLHSRMSDDDVAFVCDAVSRAAGG